MRKKGRQQNHVIAALLHARRWAPLFFLLAFPTLFASYASPGVADEVHAGSFAQRDKSMEFVPGEVVVTFKEDTPPHMRAQAHRRAPSRAVKRTRSPRMELVRLMKDTSVEAAVAAYRSMPEVHSAQPNYVYYPCETTPTDREFEHLWGLDNTGQRVNFVDGTPDADIDAPEAWDIETGKSDVVIAVIDTGIDYGHPDLADNLWVNAGEIPGNGIDDDGNAFIDDVLGWDFFDDDPDPMDPDGHGTHVAGIAGAEGNNGKAVSGVGWRLRLMALKVGGSAGFFTTFDLTPAIDYATEMGAKVINASWGGNIFDPALREAIARAGNGGILFVAAAGNGAKNIDLSPFYPASYDLQNIISVAATDQNDELAHFSNFGAVSVDVGAPGTNILSTYVKRMDIWVDDFDDGEISDWTTGGNNNSWGTTRDLSRSLPFSLADSPGGNYENDTAAWAKMDIDLSGLSGAVLSGTVRGSSEESLDQLFLQTSRNNQDWFFRKIEVFSNSESFLEDSITGAMDEAWRFFRIDIGSIDGSAGYFRFFFETNGANTDDGWYLDDLRVTTNAESTENDLRYLQGTSMAAPLVSGLAGLLLSSNPDLTAPQAVSLIIAGVDKKEGLSGKVASGGRVNAFNSLASPVPQTPATGGNGGCRIVTTGGGAPGEETGWLLPIFTVFACFLLRRKKDQARRGENP